MKHQPARKADIRSNQTRKILAAAEEMFAEKGFSGATMQSIADKADLPKANVHYYFKTKRELYGEVLQNVFDQWTDVSISFGAETDPRTAISMYIEKKLEYSFTRPYGSKVWANEVIHGSPQISEKLTTILRNWEKEKISQINVWIKNGDILPIEPRYFLYMIWATTQHFADFETQVRALNRGRPLSEKQKKDVVKNVTGILLRGVGIDV